MHICIIGIALGLNWLPKLRMRMLQLESEGQMMYYLLNYVPNMLYILILAMPIKVNPVLFFIMYLFVQPIYLLIVNVPFVCKKTTSYTKCIVCMVSTIIFNAVLTIAIHKIRTGYFIGDVPEGLYYLMVGVPILIIVIGLGIICCIRNRML